MLAPSTRPLDKYALNEELNERNDEEQTEQRNVAFAGGKPEPRAQDALGVDRAAELGRQGSRPQQPCEGHMRAHKPIRQVQQEGRT